MPISLDARLRRISSAQNSLLKELRHGFAQAVLTSDGYCAIESVHIVEEAIRSGLRFQAVFFAESARERAARLLPQLPAKIETVLVPDAAFAGAVSTEHPQGVAALVKLKQWELEDALRPAAPLVVVAAGLQDPGNLGTLIRSAEAFGASGVLLAEKTVSAFNAKTVRASAGSLFRVPLVNVKFSDASEELRARGLRLLAASSHRGTPIQEADLRSPTAIFIGNEGAGLGREQLSKMDESIVIPHSPRVESLNAGVAAAIVLYEAARQRENL